MYTMYPVASFPICKHIDERVFVSSTVLGIFIFRLILDSLAIVDLILSAYSIEQVFSSG